MPDLIDLNTITQFIPGLGNPNAAQTATLEFLISAVSADFLRAINRPDLLSANYTEVREGDGGSYMTLRHFPVTAITSLYIGGVGVPPLTPVAAPSMILTDANGSNYQIETTGGVVTSTPTGASAGAVSSILIADTNGTYSSVTSVDGVLVTTPVVPSGTGYYIDTTLDPERTRQIFLVGTTFTDTATVVVGYTAGYATVPEDIQGAVAEWITARYQERQLAGTKSIQASDRERTQASVATMPPNTERVISKYLKPLPSLERHVEHAKLMPAVRA